MQAGGRCDKRNFQSLTPQASPQVSVLVTAHRLSQLSDMYPHPLPYVCWYHNGLKHCRTSNTVYSVYIQVGLSTDRHRVPFPTLCPSTRLSQGWRQGGDRTAGRKPPRTRREGQGRLQKLHVGFPDGQQDGPLQPGLPRRGPPRAGPPGRRRSPSPQPRPALGEPARAMGPLKEPWTALSFPLREPWTRSLCLPLRKPRTRSPCPPPADRSSPLRSAMAAVCRPLRPRLTRRTFATLGAERAGRRGRHF